MGSPIERGEGCVIARLNTPLPLHNPARPLSRGDLNKITGLLNIKQGIR